MSGRPVRKTAEKGRRQMDRGRAAQQRSRSRSRSASFYTSVRHLQDGCFENLVVKLRSAVGMPPNLDSRKVYSNSSSPRGLALIIANDKFTNRRLPARPGSDVDVKNIKKLLAGLGYDIFANRNETAEQMMTTIKKFSKFKDHEKAHSTMIFVLSHGRYDEIMGSDGQSVNVHDFVGQLNADNCRFLIGKPKLFFLNCCRGALHDLGTSPGPSTSTSKKETALRRRSKSRSKVTTEEFFHQSINVDFMVAHSSFPHYISWRCTANGSWFIQAICKVFSEKAAQTDLLTMMTEVNALVQRLECHEDKREKQAPETRFSLTKSFFFNPPEPAAT
uniref:Uncharacterized protein n=1 Tax=Globodera rostochiensis TaxID=31243 RepID=A0A914HKG2_GLORO